MTHNQLNWLTGDEPTDQQTCWTMIQAAAGGQAIALERFAQIYEPVVRSFFEIRWQSTRLKNRMDDAVQDVFVECFRPGGVLGKVEPDRTGGFRAYLFGVVKNIARRTESERESQAVPDDLVANDTWAGDAFDREFARALMREASRVQANHAQHKSPDAIRRVELLKLRFGENLMIRDIAIQWEVDSAWLHHQYATAREEFRAALMAVVAFHEPSSSQLEVETICRELLVSLNGKRAR